MAIITGPTTTDIAQVDTVSQALRVTPYQDNGNALIATGGAVPATVGGILNMGLNDDVALAMRTDRLGNIGTARHTPLFVEVFEGTTINQLRWTITSTTMAATQTSAGGLTINSGNIVTASTGYMVKSRPHIKAMRGPLHCKIRARLNRVANSVMELGFGDAATFNGVNTTGAYFQVTAAGAVVPVLTYNSVDITGTDIRSLLVSTKFYVFDVIVDDDGATFVVQESDGSGYVAKQTLAVPATSPRMWSSSSVNTILRLYNSGVSPASAPNLVVTDVYVACLDIDHQRPWAYTMAIADRGTGAHPFTGAQLANWANSAAPTSATLSNTAAGYTTLGGLFQFAAIAGAATDYALFGFQVPAPANLVITGIDIDVWNTGAAGAGGPTLMLWGLAYGGTAVSLANATATRIALGSMSAPVGIAAGAGIGRLSKNFSAPIAVASGRFLNIILRMPVSTATASQIIQGCVTVNGYFE